MPPSLHPLSPLLWDLPFDADVRPPTRSWITAAPVQKTLSTRGIQAEFNGRRTLVYGCLKIAPGVQESAKHQGICNWVRTRNRSPYVVLKFADRRGSESFLDRLFLMKKPFALKSRKVQWPKSLLFTMQTGVVFDLWMAAETGTESPSNSEIVAQTDLSPSARSRVPMIPASDCHPALRQSSVNPKTG